MKAKPYEIVHCRTKPGIRFPVHVGEGGSVIDADGHIVAGTFAPADLDYGSQDKFHRAMAELLVKALNAAPH